MSCTLTCTAGEIEAPAVAFVGSSVKAMLTAVSGLTVILSSSGSSNPALSVIATVKVSVTVSVSVIVAIPPATVTDSAPPV